MNRFNQQPNLFEVLTADICRNRHDGNANSTKAFEKVKRSINPTRETILDLIGKLQNANLSRLDEIAKRLGKEKNQVSGRFSELKKLGIIEVKKDLNGEPVSVNGFAVYKLKEK